MSKVSIENYISMMESGEITNKIVRVLHYIKHNPNSDIVQMKQDLGMLHQSLTASVSMLQDEGYIEVTGERLHRDRAYSTFLFVENREKQTKLRIERLKYKFGIWVSRGLTDYKDLMSSQLVMALSLENSMKL